MFDRITAKLVENRTISAEDKQLCEYGLRQAVSMLITIATTLLIGFIFSMIWESILFMVSYIPLRSYAGGYHARTPLRCYICSVILTVGVLLGIRYVPNNAILLGSLVLVSGVVIFIFSPLADENKPLDEIETKVFKRRVRIILLTEIALVGLLWTIGLILIAQCVAFSIAVASLMVVPTVLNSILKSVRGI